MSRPKTNEISLLSGKGVPVILSRPYIKHLLMGFDMGCRHATLGGMLMCDRHKEFVSLIRTDIYTYQWYDYKNHTGTSRKELNQLIELVKEHPNKKNIIQDAGLHFYIATNNLIKWAWIGYNYGVRSCGNLALSEEEIEDKAEKEFLQDFKKWIQLIDLLQIDVKSEIWKFWLLEFDMYLNSKLDFSLLCTHYIFESQSDVQPRLSQTPSDDSN